MTAEPSLAAYVTITALLVITPGASTAVVVRNVLDRGRSAGRAAASGIATANTAWAIAAGVGITAVITRVPVAFSIIRFAGAGYLGLLGVRALVRAWRGAPAALPAEGPAPGATADHVRSAFREGVMVNLLNPPVATFYMVIVPSFLPASASASRFVLLAAIHVGLAFVCHMIWVSGFDVLRRVWVRPPARRGIDAVTGAALLALAARMLE